MQVTHVDVPPADYQIEQVLVAVHRAVRSDDCVEAPPKQVDLDLCRKQPASRVNTASTANGLDEASERFGPPLENKWQNAP
mmetsp:Transcript_21705/g.56640  ORF Transcript_21705/g.56640 Transcript_21705/m.56640 type:complete len:81 (+) Transcript_21705:577-819(+)